MRFAPGPMFALMDPLLQLTLNNYALWKKENYFQSALISTILTHYEEIWNIKFCVNRSVFLFFFSILKVIINFENESISSNVLSMILLLYVQLSGFWRTIPGIKWFASCKLKQFRHSFCQRFPHTLFLSILVYLFRIILDIKVVFLAHLTRSLKWVFLIKTCPLSVVVIVIRLRCCHCRKLSTFPSSSPKPLANFNQTLQNAFLGEGDSILFKWRAPSFLAQINLGEIITTMRKYFDKFKKSSSPEPLGQFIYRKSYLF